MPQRAFRSASAPRDTSQLAKPCREHCAPVAVTPSQRVLLVGLVGGTPGGLSRHAHLMHRVPALPARIAFSRCKGMVCSLPHSHRQRNRLRPRWSGAVSRSTVLDPMTSPTVGGKNLEGIGVTNHLRPRGAADIRTGTKTLVRQLRTCWRASRRWSDRRRRSRA